MNFLYFTTFLALFSFSAFAQDKIVVGSEAQFGRSMDLTPYTVSFIRNGKQYRVDLPFKISNQAALKLLKLADIKKVSQFMTDEEIQLHYMEYIAPNDPNKYYKSPKQWEKISKSQQENFKKKIMPKMKSYYTPLEDIAFSEVMEMLINNSQPKNDCNCVDLNGVKIKSCD